MVSTLGSSAAPAFTYADPRTCPSCRSALPERPDRCPTCDVALGHPVAVQLFSALQRVDSLTLQLRAVSRAALTPPPSAPVRAPVPGPARPLPPLPKAGPAPTGVKGSSVPAILLGLGALCLLVAAVIFLAVAWAWLGVGGRTTALVVLTAATAGGGLALHARGLRLAAEALLTVSAGLLVLDVLGADHAGWFGDLSAQGVGLLVGVALAAAGAALVAADRELAVPQLTVVLGAYVGQAALAGLVDHPVLVAAAATAGLVALAAAARSAGLTVLFVASTIAAGLTWLQLVAAALVSVDPDRVTVGGLFELGTTPGLLAASLLLLAPLVFSDTADLRGLCAIGAGTGLTGTLALPVVDNGLTAVAVTSLAAGLFWTAVSYGVPRRLVVLPMVPAGVSLLPATGVALGLAGEALESLWAPTDALRLDPSPTAEPVLLLATAVALVGFALAPASPAARRSMAPIAVLVVGLAAIATLALHPVPLLVVVLLLCAVGAGIVGSGIRRDSGTEGVALAEALVGGSVLAMAATAAVPSAAMLLLPLALLAAAAAATMLWARFGGAAELGGLALPVLLALLVSTAADVVGLDPGLRAVPVLLALAVLALARPRIEVESASAVAGTVAVLAALGHAVDEPTSLSLHLTLAGALLTLHAMVHESRRPVAWAGAALLVLATWVRLSDLGIDAPEAYTMPAALLLIVVGVTRLLRDPDAPTRTMLLPGLLLATVPSFIEVLHTDPITYRALALGLGCLVLVLVGQRLALSAPLIVGSVVGTALTLLELSPYAKETPQWVVIGVAGSLLIAVGVTWERRVVELQRAAGYIGRLR